MARHHSGKREGNPGFFQFHYHRQLFKESYRLDCYYANVLSHPVPSEADCVTTLPSTDVGWLKIYIAFFSNSCQVSLSGKVFPNILRNCDITWKKNTGLFHPLGFHVPSSRPQIAPTIYNRFYFFQVKTNGEIRNTKCWFLL